MKDSGTMEISETIAKAMAGRRLALIGFNDEDAAGLQQVFDLVAAEQCRLSAEQARPDADELASFDLLVIQLPSEGEPFPWLDAVDTLKNTKPLLLIGPAELLAKRVSANWKLTLAGSMSNRFDFLAAPWNADDVILRAYNLLSRSFLDSQAAAEPAGQGKTKVLIADDDFMTRTLVGAVLKKYDMESIVASDGKEAVQMIEAHHPAVAILDINMPNLNGFEVLSWVKENPVTRDIAVMMLTSRQKEKDVLQGFSLGADDYIGKPFYPGELAARLMRLLPDSKQIKA